MPSIEDLIRYHQECEFLDFKQEEYKSAKKHELIKDVLAFANADYDGDKYIIIGIKKEKNDIYVFNIDKPDDSAIIQQTIISNIKPDIDTEYIPFEYEGSNLMILTIKNPSDKPYATKKAVTYHKKDTVFMKIDEMKIRKGTFKLDMTREDLEKIYKKKFDGKPNFDGKVAITFKKNNKTRISLESIVYKDIPSVREILKIQKQISELKDIIDADPNKNSTGFLAEKAKRRAQELTALQVKLSHTPENFYDKDRYHLHEAVSHKIQLLIYNDGRETLKGCTLDLNIAFIEGLYVMHKIEPKKYEHSSPVSSAYDSMHYPDVSFDQDKNIKVRASIGDIKHKLEDEILKTPIRLYIEPDLIGKIINVNGQLHAENLPDPIQFQLEIEVI